MRTWQVERRKRTRHLIELGGLTEVRTPEGAVRTLPSHFSAAEPRLAGLDGFFIMRLQKRLRTVQFALPSR